MEKIGYQKLEDRDRIYDNLEKWDLLNKIMDDVQSVLSKGSSVSKKELGDLTRRLVQVSEDPLARRYENAQSFLLRMSIEYNNKNAFELLLECGAKITSDVKKLKGKDFKRLSKLSRIHLGDSGQFKRKRSLDEKIKKLHSSEPGGDRIDEIKVLKKAMVDVCVIVEEEKSEEVCFEPNKYERKYGMFIFRKIAKGLGLHDIVNYNFPNFETLSGVIYRHLLDLELENKDQAKPIPKPRLNRGCFFQNVSFLP